MYVVYVDFTDGYTYNTKEVYGFARTELGAITLEDKAKGEHPDNTCYIETIKFIEDQKE